MNSSTTSAVPDLDDFDFNSGSLIEQLLFNNRRAVIAVCCLLTVVFSFLATRLTLNANFEKTIPTQHPYIANFLQYQQELSGLGNAVRIAVENPKGTIYDAAYLQTLQKISDEIFLMPGVYRQFMRSLWTPSTRWAGVTEEGLEGGPVIPDGYNGSLESLAQLRINVERSGIVGQLVALDAKSSVIYIPLLATDSNTGQRLDYAKLSVELEQIRAKYESEGVRIHITGFAKMVGDLIDSLWQILLFFAAAIVIAAAMIYWYTRCVRSTCLVVACSLIAVVWQLGMLPLLGYNLDPYSILVPFLVFAIGMSHGAQKMNGIMQDIARGADKLIAARLTFRRLFLAGLTALLCDAVGFAVLMVIKIEVIQDLAIIASIGVAVLIFTNLVLLPILLSFTGVSARAAKRALVDEKVGGNSSKHPLWAFLDLFTQRKWASVAVLVGVILAGAGYLVSLQLKVGDLDPGAPELRPDSRYNRDVAFMNQSYGASSDVLAIMVKTPESTCAAYDTLMRVDQLEWELQQLPGVESTQSLAGLVRQMMVGLNEGAPRWYDMTRNQDMLNTVTASAPRGLYNETCDLLTVYVFLKDHRADTLARVVSKIEEFAAENNSETHQFLLAAGSAGIEAATNVVVKKASHEMLFWVYGAVILLCFITFRSWRAVLVAILPLMLTSILGEALMVGLGMGVKVATLPVIALGVGIGVDYALYILSILIAWRRMGLSLSEAYYKALLFTGQVVMLTGLTLAVGVATWAFSPIKFQADMGILLAFMFIWNMLGALVLLPALAYFLFPASTNAAATTNGPIAKTATL